MNDFLPGGYKVPEKPSDYLKLTEGTHKFRILTSPILGWEVWDKTGDKPQVKRYAYDAQHPADAKHIWGIVVYNYEIKRVQLLSISQSTIQEDLRALASNEDWGTPLNYDITILRTGKTMNDTKYSITPSPKKPITAEMKKAFDESGADLQRWIDGGEAFKRSEESVEATLSDFPDVEVDAEVPDNSTEPDDMPF